MSDKKSKFKIGPNITYLPRFFLILSPNVKVKTKNKYYGVKGEYNFIDTDTTNFKITGSVGKGFSRTDVTNPYGTDTFKGEGPLDKEIRFKLTKKFSKGGTVKDYIKDLL
jgi:hypothetical protein